MSIPAIIATATLTIVEIDFLELVFLSMAVYSYNDTGVYKSLFSLSSQDFRLPLANWYSENDEPVSTL